MQWPNLPQGVLMLVTEPSPNLPSLVAEAVAGGVNIVQWRDKTTPQPDLMAQVALMRTALSPSTLLIINGPLTLEEELGDGLHLPDDGLSVSSVRPALRSDALVGRSVHSVQSAQAAEQDGADYLVAGTIYASSSHPEVMPQGIDFLREVCGSVGIPVLAIGGVTPERVAECIDAGAAGIAVLSPLIRAADPRAAAQQYRAALDDAWKVKS